VPVAVRGLSGVTAIAAGGGFGLALLSNGTVMAWGSNNHGELGNGESTGPEQCNGEACSTTPVAVSGLSGVTAIATGNYHALALLSNGTVKAWGFNADGELGDGSTTNSDVPVTVSGLSGVTAIAANGYYSLALLSNGTVKAWGENFYGQLGNGTSGVGTNSDVPVAVSGLSGVTAIAAGFWHALALLSNGTVKAWGDNREGQLGNGKTTNSDVPVAVSGLSEVAGIAGGFEHSLALLGNGTVKAWGYNRYGQLGNGTYINSDVPVAVSGLTGEARGIAAGAYSSLAFGPEFPVGELPPEPQPEEMFGEDNPGEPNQKRACAGDPVSCATGNLTESQTDLSLSGRGVPLALTRTYNAQAAVTQPSPGLFGYGWSSSFSDHLVINPTAKTVSVVQANGSSVIFTGATGVPGELTAPKWAQSKLVLNSDGTYQYTLPSRETFHFDASGRLLSEADRSGNTTTMNRNAEGRLESVTDAAGRKLTLSYNSEGQVESVKDPLGNTVKYAYEGGNLVSVTEPGETSPRWQFKYDPSHRLTVMTDGRGGTTTNEYDSFNRVISQKDPAERTTSFEYSALAGFHTHTTITNKATGSVTNEVFTLGYEPESITHGSGIASEITASFTYDEAGDLKSATDGNGHTTKYGYNSTGDKTSMIDANEHETKWTYNGTHDVLTMTTPDGETTTYVRNGAGEPEAIERPAPGSTTQRTKYTYDSQGDLESMTDPLGHTWKYGYDSQGDRTSETDPEGDKRTWEYSEDSREIATVSPRGNVEGAEASKYTTKTERDAQGRPLTVTDPLGHKTKYTYDGNGNLETQIDPNGDKTKYTYDANNEQTKVEQPNATIIETGYDGAGQVTSQTDGNKHMTKYVRNVLERIVEVIDPRERKTTKEYDRAGNLTKLTDAAKRVTTNTYDHANRLTEVSYSDGKTHAVKYEYNGDGVRTHMTDGSGETSYTYDQLDRLTESKDGHGDVAKYEYDLANELTKITYPNGKAVTRGYDKTGRLEKVTDWLEHTTKFAYDPDFNLTRTTFPTGTSNVDKYVYNEADQMSEDKMTKGAETLASLVYTRDNNGQVKKTTSKGLPGAEVTEYVYDVNSRLTKAGTTGYEYDPANDPTKIAGSAYTYDKASELETGTGFKYTYDEMGERTKTAPTSGAATTYGYDQAGNLISIERPKEGKIAGMTDTYTYDGNNLRISQTIAGTKTFLTWEMAEALPLILNDGTNSYIYGPGGVPVEQISSAGAVLYLHHDQQGSTRLLTSSTGKSEATFTYDPYGNTTGTTGTATTPLGYDAQYTSADTGLIYLRARVYDPKTAQFLTIDPLNSQTHQPYAYAGDNPLAFTDPTGMCGAGSVSEALESINPFSSENCAYQGTKALVEAFGGDATKIAEATALAAFVFAPVPPVALAFAAVSSAASAYAAGQETANREYLAAALDGLAGALGGTAAAERVLASLESLIPALGGKSVADQTQAVAEMLDRLGYGALAASILNPLAAHKETTVTEGGEPGFGQC
jgi:RHS repeat-associated protein